MPMHVMHGCKIAYTCHEDKVRLFRCLLNALAAPQILPDPLSVLECQSRAPAYLTPEATRPLAAPVHRGGRSAPAPEQRQATPH